MLLVASLQKSCEQWEPVQVPGNPDPNPTPTPTPTPIPNPNQVPGKGVADPRWNVGLEAAGAGEAPGDLELLKAGLTNMIGGQTLEAEKEAEQRRRAAQPEP